MRPPEPSGACLPPPKPAAPAPSGGRTPGCEPRMRGVPARGARDRPGAAGGTRKRRALPPPRNSGTRGAVPVAPRTGRRGRDPRATCPGGRTAATGRDEAPRLRAGPAPSRKQPRRAARQERDCACAGLRRAPAPPTGPSHISRERNGRVSRALLRESRRKRLRRGPGAVCAVRVPAPVAHGVSRGRGRGRLSRARPRTCPSALFPSGAARPDLAVPPLAESSTAPPARAQRVATCGRPRARGLRFWGLSLGHPARHPGRLHCGSVATWTPHIRCGRCPVHCWVSRCAPSQQP